MPARVRILAEPCRLSGDSGISNDSRLSEQAAAHFPSGISDTATTLLQQVQHPSFNQLLGASVLTPSLCFHRDARGLQHLQ